MPYVQLSVELTKLAGGRFIEPVAASIHKLARDLRKAGSDLLVEEDLASIFSRGKIDPKLEFHFKDVVKVGATTPMHQGSQIVLDSQPGPTTQRAIRDSYYMATLIQLSMLAWFHEKTTFSSALVECMNRRFELNVPGANPDASYPGISSTLTAICAETGSFPWALYAGLVEAKLPKSISFLASIGEPILNNVLKGMPPNVLLAAMDYLYLVQSLPRDRVMQTQTQDGLMPLIIWAHYILGLTVVVQGSPDGNVKFGDEAVANVIVNWLKDRHEENMDLEWPVFLLDANMEVILKSPSDLSTTRIDAQERIRLEGYGTTTLRRRYNRVKLIDDDNPVYSDSAQMATALATCMSIKLFRRHYYSRSGTPNDLSYDLTDSWRIFEAAQLLFSGIKMDRTAVNKWFDDIAGVEPENVRLPSGLKFFFHENFEGAQGGIRMILIPCAILVLTFAHVSDVQSCANLPLVSGHDQIRFRDDFIKQLRKWNGRSGIEVQEGTWFNQAVKLLVGVRHVDRSSPDDHRCFLVSEYGWSVHLNNVEDIDPSTVEKDLIRIQHGVPVNTRTNERKWRILDAPSILDHPPQNEVVEKSGFYVPRCLSKVVNRVEQYSSREQDFWHMCRFDVDESSYVSDPLVARFSMHAGYRFLHAALWGALQPLPCEHVDGKIDKVELDLDTATVKGFRWVYGNERREDVHERICILLVSGDPRARWLALTGSMASDYFSQPGRQVLLRGEDCCENCAVKTAAEMPLKWLVIL